MKSDIDSTLLKTSSSSRPSISSGSAMRTARTVARLSASRVMTSGATGAGGCPASGSLPCCCPAAPTGAANSAAPTANAAAARIVRPCIASVGFRRLHVMRARY